MIRENKSLNLSFIKHQGKHADQYVNHNTTQCIACSSSLPAHRTSGRRRSSTAPDRSPRAEVCGGSHVTYRNTA
jgi:hypothetical protein